MHPRKTQFATRQLLKQTMHYSSNNFFYAKNKAFIDREKSYSRKNLPGSFFRFLKGTNFAPIANAIGGPNIKPRASIPGDSRSNTKC